MCQLKEFDDETIHSTCCRLDVNTFEIKLGHNHIRGLYPMAAMMAHSCIANTNHVIREDGYELSVYASVPIKKGQALFLNYASSLDGISSLKQFKSNYFWKILSRNERTTSLLAPKQILHLRLPTVWRSDGVWHFFERFEVSGMFKRLASSDRSDR